jgi:hypothetical protein
MKKKTVCISIYEINIYGNLINVGILWMLKKISKKNRLKAVLRFVLRKYYRPFLFEESSKTY